LYIYIYIYIYIFSYFILPEGRRKLLNSIAFIDITKAFDSISRKALWRVLSGFGVPPHFAAICKSLHEDNWARVSHSGKIYNPFLTLTDVRQGCVIAPLLFNMFMAALSIIVDMKSKVRGIGIRYRVDGCLFNLARLRTIVKTRTCFITDLMYADDCALIARTPEQLQYILDTYTEAYTALGLKLNKTKTKIMSTPQAKSNVLIQVYAHQLENVESFDYLGSMLNSKANIDLET
jgi:hypothetical protein